MNTNKNLIDKVILNESSIENNLKIVHYVDPRPHHLIEHFQVEQTDEIVSYIILPNFFPTNKLFYS